MPRNQFHHSSPSHAGFQWSILTAIACQLVLVVVADDQCRAADTLTGQQIFAKQCAACHGAHGEGVQDHYDKPLIGERSVKALAQLITETMPEDDPETCVGDDAFKVASYIFGEFYSPDAQARNQPPRIELSRLTNRQYENAVADLFGFSADSGKWDEKRGLYGQYYEGRRIGSQRSRKIDRLDETVQFDFGEGSPGEGIEAKEFSIRWTGGVLAPETGNYEFIIKTENGARLWINDNDEPLIDAWVRSGVEIERKETIRLLGGRVYPVRLEVYKSEKAKEKTASISLLWKPPRQSAELIPTRYLSPNQFARVLLVNTPFPPDDRSVGYERGSSVSKEWDAATTYAAVEVAGFVAGHLRQLAGYGGKERDVKKKVIEFCQRLAERAFRRPLSAEQQQFFVDQHFQDSTGPNKTGPDKTGQDDAELEMAVKKSVLLVLKSPRFLYREVGTTEPDAYSVASRISFHLWDAPPDRALLAAASKNQLKSREQVTAQIERMLPDQRTKAKLREFLHHWLQVDRVIDVSKDGELFPSFDETVVADLRRSLDLFLDDIIDGESADFRQLLLADSIYLNGRLAKIYGADLPEGAAFEKVTFDPEQRAGILSHPFLMTGFAYYSTSSPIHRGVFVARSLLGRSLRPPPEAFTPLAPELHPNLSTRERVILQTSPTSCNSCHGMINPLGFPLENFDAIGRYRQEEKNRPLDVTGHYDTLNGETVEFNGVRELANFLANNKETHKAFVQQLFHHLVKQPIRAFGTNQPDVLTDNFAQNNFDINRLIVDIITVSALSPAGKKE